MGIFSKLFNKNKKDEQLTLHEKWALDSESYKNPNYKVKTGENQCYNCENRVRGNTFKCLRFEGLPPKEILFDEIVCEYHKEIIDE